MCLDKVREVRFAGLKRGIRQLPLKQLVPKPQAISVDHIAFAIIHNLANVTVPRPLSPRSARASTKLATSKIEVTGHGLAVNQARRSLERERGTRDRSEIVAARKKTAGGEIDHTQ
jgi:hypothetical protein